MVSGRAKFTQAQGSLGRNLFQAYDCEEGTKFGINLTTFLECLQIFGPGSLAQTSVSMAYQEVSCSPDRPARVFPSLLRSARRSHGRVGTRATISHGSAGGSSAS